MSAEFEAYASSGLFAPGIKLQGKTKSFINNVHIIAIHGWQLFNSTATETSENFTKLAKKAVRELLDAKEMFGTTIKTTSLSGCKPFKDEKKNNQTLKHRMKGCIEELEDSKAMDEIKRSDMVYFVAHSQGTVVAVLLIDKLIKMGIIDPLVGQLVGLLSMAGVHHGTHESATSLPLTRKCTSELNQMRDPHSTIFSECYLPSLTIILNMGVIIIAVAAYGDRVVNLASSIIDGIDHPNIYRAFYAHPKYLQSNSQSSGNDDAEPSYKHDKMMWLWKIIVQMRNEGTFEDFARFCTTPSIVEVASKAVEEIVSVGYESFCDSPKINTGSNLGDIIITGASFTLTCGYKYLTQKERFTNTHATYRDGNAHSTLYTHPSLYQFGMLVLLAKFHQNANENESIICANNNNEATELPFVNVRETFDVEPNTFEFLTVGKVLTYILYEKEFVSSALQEEVQMFLRSILKSSSRSLGMSEDLVQQLQRVAKSL